MFGGSGTGGVRYGGAYGINALQFVQSMKKVLIDAGIAVHESTEVRGLAGHKAATHAT